MLHLPPRNHAEFLHWYRTQTNWNEGQPHLTPETVAGCLKSWLTQMIHCFPDLNRLAASQTSAQGSPPFADYSIGANVIYAAFGWPNADQAYEAAFSLAAEYQLGFFAASSNNGELWFPDHLGNMQIVHPQGHQPKTTILFKIDRDSTDVKTLYNVFSWGREALSEYLFYGEIDSHAVKADNTGDLSNAAFHAEVSVNFESDVLSTAAIESAHYVGHVTKYEKFSLFLSTGNKQLSDMNPEEFCSYVASDSTLLISAEGNGYRTFTALAILGIVQFTSVKIDGERVTTIRVSAKDRTCNIGWLWSKFVTLCREYTDIPMNRFHGAIRE